MALPNRKTFNAFDKRYDKYIETEKQNILTALGGLETDAEGQALSVEASEENDNYRFITLKDNYSFCSLHSYVTSFET